MHTALDAPPERLDADEKKFVAAIREHGWFRTQVSADDEGPGFSYTTGLCINAGHPELILFGLKGDIARDVLWDLFREAQAGFRLPSSTRTDRAFGNLPAYAFPVAKRHYPEYLGWSRWFYGGDDFGCLQLVWPDRAGLFPWEAGFDAALGDDQPDLSEAGWTAAVADRAPRVGP
jgi:hypothetical protein